MIWFAQSIIVSGALRPRTPAHPHTTTHPPTQTPLTLDSFVFRRFSGHPPVVCTPGRQSELPQTSSFAILRKAPTRKKRSKATTAVLLHLSEATTPITAISLDTLAVVR